MAFPDRAPASHIAAGSIRASKPVVCARFDDAGACGKRIRLGIMGGTFDPIHVGHLACAEQVREAFGLEGVIFMPAGDPWMKRGRGVTDAEARFDMVKAAVADNPRFDASRLEIDRCGKTYTVDTLRALRAHYPENVELYFISGADALQHILEWRDADEVGRLARLVAVTRPGYEIDDARKRYMRTHGGIRHVSMFEATALAVSSTDLREKVRSGRSIRYLVPQVVADYIEQQGLYREACRPA
ncbi:MAG: nicotinate-nucleotide adenylyltransferase [Slackia sp.]|nr:nicotinate-nucleotide adenylyltransferase [Slackia sp.]